jgi:multimeric flavodoxin WrbA
MINIKLLGINGSPRNGNSLFLLEKALESGISVSPESVQTTVCSFKGKTINPCIACGYCAEHNGACVHRDDFEELRGLWMESDAIIYSVPVYHMTCPGQVKCFIDRLGNSMFGLFRSKWPPGKEYDKLPKLHKSIGNIAQGCHIFSGQETTINFLIQHSLLMQCIPIQGDLWESYIGVGGWTSTDIGRDALKKLAEKEDNDTLIAVQASRALGRRVVEMSMVTKSGLLACKDLFKGDILHEPLFNRLEQGSWGEDMPWYDKDQAVDT